MIKPDMADRKEEIMAAIQVSLFLCHFSLLTVLDVRYFLFDMDFIVMQNSEVQSGWVLEMFSF